MKKFLTFIIFMFFLISFSSARSEDKTKDKEMAELQEQVKELQEKVEHLESDIEPRTNGSDQHEQTNAAEGTALAPKERKMEIESREAFNDRQEAAPRPYDLTLDPNYRGFIPIPHTNTMIRFNAKPRVDTTIDNTYTGNSNVFATADIPVTGEATKGGGRQFNMNGQGSQLSMDVRAPQTTGNPRFYYENDFNGPGTAYLNFKVRHLYGEFFNGVVGQTYTVFEDADAWPDTVDYEGPNACISARRPLVKYLIMFDDNWGMTLSLEKSDSQVDTFGYPTANSENHIPDGGFNVRWAKKGTGHVQFGTIFRNIGVNDDIFGKQNTFGWGLNLSANLNLFSHDSFQTQLTYGQGIFYFLNDAVQYNDAAFNAANELVPLPVIALVGGYTHQWSKRFRSTGSFGFVNLQNSASQAWNSYHRTYYASLNLVMQIYKRLSIGAEGLYGYKQVKSHATGQAFRGQISIMYALFR